MFRILLVFILSVSAFAGFHKTKGNVRSFDREDETYVITLWDSNKVHRLSDEHAAVPCLLNAWKARMKVDLIYDEAGELVDCKLASKPHPGTRTAR